MPLGLVGASLLSSALQGLFSIGATASQNAFNSPKAQLRRLRKAGLPLAYMYKGNVAGQSQVPTLSIDPTLGLSKKIELQNQTKLTKSQVDKNESETESIDLSNAIQQGINEWMLDKGKRNWGGGKYTGTNQQVNLQIEQDQKNAVAFAKKHEEQLLNIQQLVETKLLSQGVPYQERIQALEKIKQQIVNMGKQAGLMSQLQEIRDFEEWLNSTVTQNIDSLPKWAQALTASLLKLQSYR